MIKISVIMPVYNVEKYLRECLDSIVNQTLREIEIICINDCSTDGSLDILNEYAYEDDRIIIVNNKTNIGAAKSRNIGIHMAKGKYMSILDSDDFCDLRMLEIAYQRCCDDNADIGIYDYARYDNISKNIIYNKLPLCLAKNICSGVFSFEQITKNIFQMFSCAPFTKFYKRSFILESGIEFQDLKNANDTYFGNMVLTQAKRMIYIDSIFPLYYYRVNLSTQISNNRSKNPKCIWEAIMEIKKSLIERKVFDCCRKSFNSYVVESFIYSINNVDNNYKKDLYDFLTHEGLEKLEMLDCSKDEFRNEYEYNLYKNLFFGNYDKFRLSNVGDHIYSDDKKTIKLFDYLKESGYEYGLWGIGSFGKSFLNLCKEHDFYFKCLIDEDPIKEGMQIDSYIVKSFQNTDDIIDAVIITNTRYGNTVLNIINKSNSKIKLIDIDAYYRWGFKIEECILKV